MTTMASQITSLTVVYSIVFRAQIKENIKAPRHWPLCGEFTGTGEFPAQRASNAENVSVFLYILYIYICSFTKVNFICIIKFCLSIRILIQIMKTGVVTKITGGATSNNVQLVFVNAYTVFGCPVILKKLVSYPFIYIIMAFGVNTLRPRQNELHFAYDIFKCISLNENAWISL